MEGRRVPYHFYFRHDFILFYFIFFFQLSLAAFSLLSLMPCHTMPIIHLANKMPFPLATTSHAQGAKNRGLSRKEDARTNDAIMARKTVFSTE